MVIEDYETSVHLYIIHISLILSVSFIIELFDYRMSYFIRMHRIHHPVGVRRWQIIYKSIIYILFKPARL